MRPIPAIAARQAGLFTTAQAVAAGWTSHALRHAVAVDHLERVRAGLYCRPLEGGDKYALELRRVKRDGVAFAMTNRDVPLSHGNSGALHGLTLLNTEERVCATFARGRRGPMPGVHRHRGRLADSSVQRLGGVLLTRAERAVVEIGHEHGPDAAIVAADSALRAGLATMDSLVAVLDEMQLWPGIEAARQAVTLADPRAESALESISRLRIADSGLPLPDLQPNILTADGEFIGRCDFYWDGPGVIGEADGMGKYDDRPLSLIAEKRRQAALERLGLIVVRWSWDDLGDFRRTAFELASAFQRGLRPDRAPRLWVTMPTGPQLRAVS